MGDFHTQTVTRELDGAVLEFRAYDGLWMIDRVIEPSNERGDEDEDEGTRSTRDTVDAGDVGDTGNYGDTGGTGGFEGSTAVACDEIRGMTETERRSYHARQMRKLGLPARGGCARLIWSMIQDFDRFAP